MICIFRQGSKKSRQGGSSLVATAMITSRRMPEDFLIYAGGAGALNVM